MTIYVCFWIVCGCSLINGVAIIMIARASIRNSKTAKQLAACVRDLADSFEWGSIHGAKDRVEWLLGRACGKDWL